MTEHTATGRRWGVRALVVVAVLLVGPPCLLWLGARTERARLLAETLVGQEWRGTVAVGAVSYEPPLRVVVSDLRLADSGGSEPWLVVPRLTLEPSLRDPFRRLGRVVLVGPHLRLRRTVVGLEPLDRLGIGPSAGGLPPSLGRQSSPRGWPSQNPVPGHPPVPSQRQVRGSGPSPFRTQDPPSLELPPLPVEQVRIREGEVVWVDEALPLPLTVTARGVGVDLDVDELSGTLHALADLGPLGRVELRADLRGASDLVAAERAGSGFEVVSGSLQARLAGVSLEKSQDLLPEEVRGLAGGVTGSLSLVGEVGLERGCITSSSLQVQGTNLAVPLVLGSSVGERLEATVTGLHDAMVLRGTGKLRVRDADGSGAEGAVVWAREGPILRLSQLVVTGDSARVEGEGFLALGREGLLDSLVGNPSYEVALRGGDVVLEGAGGPWSVRHLEVRVVPGAVDVVRADLARGAGPVRQVSGILALDGAGSLTGRLAGPDGAVVDVAGMLWQPTMSDAGEE